jgi:predicted amidohydrolase YtcJ
MTRTSDHAASSPPRPTTLPRSALAFSWWLCFAVLCAATGLAAKTAAPPAGGYARTIFVNGTVIPVVPQTSGARALAVAADGTILAVGDEASVRKYELKGTTEVVNLNNKTLMPGFVEPHTHAIMTAFNANNPIMLNLSSFAKEQPTLEVIEDELTKAMARSPFKEAIAQGGWLLAFGVDPARTKPFMASLNATELDKVSKDVPIFVLNQSGHLAYVNNRAIDLAGIRNEPNPPGGVYVRKDGQKDQPLTGELEEAPAYMPFMAKIKDAEPWKSFNEPMQLSALRTTYDQFAAAGVTTASEMSLGLVTGSVPNEYRLLRILAGDTPMVRIRAYVSALATTPADLKMTPNEGNDLLKVIGVKFVADGSTQGLSAALETAYDYPAQTTNQGTLNYPMVKCGLNAPLTCKASDPLFDQAKHYMDAGWQLAIHSNGDRSTAQVLDLYESLLGTSPDQKARDAFRARRFRIEHLTVADDSQVERIRVLGITPSMTNGHVYFWGYAFGDPTTKILGWERTEQIDPARSLLARGVKFSFNSDSPITPAAPLRYISTAVSRDWQQPPTTPLPAGKSQGISVDAAIRAVTLDAAYQLLLDKEIGSLEPRKQADLVILEKDPRTTTAANIMNIRVLATYLAGKQRYRAPVPEYGSLQNDANTEYRCNKATHLQATYTSANCRMRFISTGNGVYAIQNVSSGEYFQNHIGTMAASASSDAQRWKIVGANGRYTIQNVSNHEFMTRRASALSSTVGPDEYWTIEERLP